MKTFARLMLIIAVAVASLQILYGCSGDAPVSKARAQPRPESSPIVRQFRISSLGVGQVTEFRDSAGRICVYVYANRGSVLDCGRPLPPLEYEQLELPPAP